MLEYLKKYWLWAALAPLFMCGEVFMDLLQPRLMKTIVDEGVLGLSNGGVGDLGLISTTGAKMIGLVAVGGFCGVMSGVFANLCSQNFGNDLRKAAFRNTLALSPGQTDRFSTGSIITRITNDITQVQQLVTQCIRGFVRTGMLIVGGIVCMLSLDLSFGAVIACGLPFILFCVIYFIGRANPMFGILQQKLDNVNSVMQENITGARVVKAYVREDYENARFGRANNELVDTQLNILVLFSYMTPIMNILLNASVVAVIFLGGIRVRGGELTPGAVMAAITYITQILNAVMRMTMIFQTISRGTASGRRVMELLECSPAITDGDFDGDTKLKGKVEFKNVSFGYGKTDILKNISFTVNPGETIGILGETGCGKTSLVQLIPRFYDVREGAVLVDGIDVRDYKLEALRDKVSLSLQKSELFNTTIKENILWGRQDASDEEVARAAEIARAKDFIESSPDGFDTIVAEKGMSLSGGQKQRIAVSRSILKGAEILIFDDCTGALDLKTEAELYERLNRAEKNMTKIIIAQRIASVKSADRIAVIDGGRLAAFDSHEKLLETSEIYRDIYNSQLKAG